MHTDKEADNSLNFGHVKCMLRSVPGTTQSLSLAQSQFPTILLTVGGTFAYF